jgi:hypothetical protein
MRLYPRVVTLAVAGALAAPREVPSGEQPVVPTNVRPDAAHARLQIRHPHRLRRQRRQRHGVGDRISIVVCIGVWARRVGARATLGDQQKYALVIVFGMVGGVLGWLIHRIGIALIGAFVGTTVR